MKESWQNLSDLITNPSATFERLKFNPKWVLVFVVFCLLSLGVGGAVAPFTQQLLISNFVESSVPNETISVWHIFVLTIVISIFAGVNRIQACFVAVFVWLLRIGIEVMFIAMFLS